MGLKDPLMVEGMMQRFGRLLALDNVSATFFPGEVHAVLGENGAGKSTLMNALAGFLRPEAGQVRMGDRGIELGSPLESQRAGIQMVHQHFMLVPQFSVDENLALAKLHSLAGGLRLAQLTRPVHELARQLKWDVSGPSRTGDLPVGVQQRIEILKALSEPSPILILDEPTAVLGPDEVQDLFRVLRTLKSEGRIVILIAHKLSEVLAIADRVTVLRHGRKVAETSIPETTADQLAQWMVGDVPTQLDWQPPEPGDVLIRARGLSVRDRSKVPQVDSVDLEVRRGEVLGIGGVDGNGQTELAEALAGLRPLAAGSLEVFSKKVAYIPQDRQSEGLAVEFSVLENLFISGHQQSEFRWGPFLRLGRARLWAQDMIQKYKIKCHSLDQSVRSLSGGNQQKVVLARSLDHQPDLLIAMNPTRGLDLHATSFVHDRLREAVQNGAGLILLSTDQDELAALATRTKFMSRGRLVADTLAEALRGDA